jgi:hypothetical protein
VRPGQRLKVVQLKSLGGRDSDACVPARHRGERCSADGVFGSVSDRECALDARLRQRILIARKANVVKRIEDLVARRICEPLAPEIIKKVEDATVVPFC